ncbi:hypothetical protein TIFTF001_034436 [Ficus carica]|uniref:Uncharacterized protein n=1 Tax=Ficus carica TaxID=3494 RepID=A0AA88J944_FICCA|nr:hypothetical protein TIFTF001_034436 [Ficus carica]
MLLMQIVHATIILFT